MLVLSIGDIIGKPGRLAVQRLLPELYQQYGLDLVIANGENNIKNDHKMPLDAVDADTLAQEIGNPKAVNLIVLGFALAVAEKKGKTRNTLFCSPAEINTVLEGRFGKKKEMLKASLKALEAGYKA